MWFAKGRRSFGAKLAGLYALLFCLSVALLGAATVFLVDGALRRQIDERIAAEMDELIALGGAEPVAAAIRSRMAAANGLDYRLETASGALVAGNLANTGHGPGWFYFGTDADGENQDAADSFRGYAVRLGGHLLTIADDTDGIDNIGAALASVFAATALLTAAIAIAGGLGLSGLYLRRLGLFEKTAEAITAGALSERMPLAGTDDEFDGLSRSLNRMLDRNAALLENQRQISNGIAHEMRTPLTRLRQTLEAGASGKNPAAAAEALRETDNLLETFGALLRIAEVEEGARKRNFAAVDLGRLAQTVHDAYAASFEETGRQLTAVSDADVAVEGDKDLLMQLLSNLVENALIHTAPGTHTAIEARRSGDAVRLTVRDNGAGVPEAERPFIFGRFYRAQRSRALPGSGLGLSFVRAVADLHGAALSTADAAPGFEIALRWRGEGIGR